MDPMLASPDFDHYLTALAGGTEDRLRDLTPLSDSYNAVNQLESQLFEALPPHQHALLAELSNAQSLHWVNSIEQAFKVGFSDGLRFDRKLQTFLAQVNQVAQWPQLPPAPNA